MLKNNQTQENINAYYILHKHFLVVGSNPQPMMQMAGSLLLRQSVVKSSFFFFFHCHIISSFNDFRG